MKREERKIKGILLRRYHKVLLISFAHVSEAVEKLWKSCGKAVEKLWKSCGKAAEKLWKSCGKAVENLVLYLQIQNTIGKLMKQEGLPYTTTVKPKPLPQPPCQPPCQFPYDSL